MSSFYGGKQGRTYHIVKSFDSIENMVTSFAISTYADVLFGEYVLIDTPNKQSQENGCLYRRGFDVAESPVTTTVQNPGAGAIYIGRICGPAGRTPGFQFISTVSTTADLITAVSTVSNTDLNGNPTQVTTTLTFPSFNPTASVNYIPSTASASVVVTPKVNQPFKPVLNFKLPVSQLHNQVSSVSFNANSGNLTATVTTYSNTNVAGTTASTIGNINYPKTVTIDDSKNVKVTYANNSVSTIGQINDITSVVSQDSGIQIHFRNGSSSNIIPIGSQFHVQGDYESLSELQQAHPNGFTGSQQGWVATINGVFYAYDHRSNSGWYQIGSISEDAVYQGLDPTAAVLFATTAVDGSKLNHLKVGGAWFVVE